MYSYQVTMPDGQTVTVPGTRAEVDGAGTRIYDDDGIVLSSSAMLTVIRLPDGEATNKEAETNEGD